MGRITASVTHDMKNVLAIIKESAGLMEDLIALNKELPVPVQEKFSKVCARIVQQVERGVGLTGRLNTFAHSPDDILGEVDLNKVIDQVAGLASRFARLKGVGIEVRPHPKPVTLSTDPLKIQMLLVGVIDLLLSLVQSGTVIALHPNQESGGIVSVTFSAGTPGDKDLGAMELSASPLWSEVAQQSTELDATLASQPENGWVVVQFKTGRT